MTLAGLQVLAGMLQQPGGAELASEFLRRSGASSDALHALQAAQSLSQSGTACAPRLPLLHPALGCALPAASLDGMCGCTAAPVGVSDSVSSHPSACVCPAEQRLHRGLATQRTVC